MGFVHLPKSIGVRPTLSGFTPMVAKKWRKLSDAEKAVLNLLLA
tara:strand:- start:538 stop:669 length:132 start_codon:yes stop_codon:yes gene_type:complete